MSAKNAKVNLRHKLCLQKSKHKCSPQDMSAKKQKNKNPLEDMSATNVKQMSTTRYKAQKRIVRHKIICLPKMQKNMIKIKRYVRNKHK